MPRPVAGLFVAAVVGAAGVFGPVPAQAQLGASGNVPPQRLFDTDRPARLDTGLGTMAGRDPKPVPVPVRRGHRPVRR